MMSKTHLAVGMACAVTFLAPHNLATALPVAVGAAAGSVMCDIDCAPLPDMRDVIFGRVTACSVVVTALVLDALTGMHVLGHAIHLDRMVLLVALMAFAAACALARHSDHRGYSHSLLALAMEAVPLWILLPSIVPAYVIGFLSHITLDLTNRKAVRILFPMKKGFCLRLFYADKKANSICLVLGCVWLGIIIAYRIAVRFGLL